MNINLLELLLRGQWAVNLVSDEGFGIQRDGQTGCCHYHHLSLLQSHVAQVN